MSDEGAYLQLPLGRFLEEVASGRPAPGGGAAAAMTVALAAGLCAMTARSSGRHLGGAGALAEEADALRTRVAALGQADAEAYGLVMDVRAEPEGGDPDRRRARLADALSDAAAVPMEVVEIGGRVARLAAELAEGGNPTLRGDALAAALLARGGLEAAAALVEINLAGTDDARRARADRGLTEAAEAVARARRSAGVGGPSTLTPGSSADGPS